MNAYLNSYTESDFRWLVISQAYFGHSQDIEFRSIEDIKIDYIDRNGVLRFQEN